MVPDIFGPDIVLIWLIVGGIGTYGDTFG